MPPGSAFPRGPALWLAIFAAGSSGSAWLVAPPAQGEGVDFVRDVFPILQRSCFECHGERLQKGKLRLDRSENLLASGVLIPGDPDASEIVRRVSLPPDDEDAMPARGEPLTSEEVALLARWIADGAVWPADFHGQHWAYVAPRRPELPAVERADWAQNEIDRFVLQRLEREGLAPSPPAEPATLLRRLYLDLVGLPPSPAEVEAFEADPSAAAYERAVDELLARPQFGERWARPWLDLARYADSHGYQRDNLRDAWAFRDWVVQALNADMPFDRFTIEQLAGDLLPDASESQLIATGFQRCTPADVEAGSIPEESRIEAVIDRVNTTASVWLGSTLECAQCHDHKYDPFTIRDYYRMFAFYNNSETEIDLAIPNQISSIRFTGPMLELSSVEGSEEQAQLRTQLADLERRLAARRAELETDLEAWSLGVRARIDELPLVHTLPIEGFESEGETDSHERLADGSVLLVGQDPPDTDVYLFRSRVAWADIRGFRLDVLMHESLPGRGPGRGDPKRTNFILTDLAVSSGEGRLAFAEAVADYAPKQAEVALAIDDNPGSGWGVAPEFCEHWGVFLLAEPLDASEGVELTFRMAQEHGGARTLGRFRWSALTGGAGVHGVSPEVARILRGDPTTWSAEERERLLEQRLSDDPETTHLRNESAKLEKRLTGPATTLVMRELPEPRTTHLFLRGDYRSPGEVLEPGTPAFLNPLPPGPPNRLTLARWLVARDNPLTARVTVNRWWAELFGTGLVPTPEDFGTHGDMPSHPELLDWLAVELMEDGWSMKRCLRRIVLSSTYRQSSTTSSAQLERDDANRLLARGPRLRMDAEMVRDNALAISGLLSLEQGGPPIRPYQPAGVWNQLGGTRYSYEVSPGTDRFRRGLYVVLKRGSPYPSFVNFDATGRLACVVRRSRTNTPLQALTLLNDPVYVEATKALALRLMTELDGADLAERLEHAMRLCVARKPTTSELARLTRLFEEERAARAADPEACAALAREVELVAGLEKAEFGAWYSVATTVLNLHETITKD